MQWLLLYFRRCAEITKELSSSFGWPTKIHSNSYSFNLGNDFAKSSISIAPLYLKSLIQTQLYFFVLEQLGQEKDI